MEDNKLKMQTKDTISENILKIGKLFPNVITEVKDGYAIDFEELKQELSKDIVDSKKERYQITWPGKKEAILNANTPINKTLRPLREKSVDFENAENIYIEGDNLEALKILQESYLNKIKCIYIDPPYNTGNDFIYNDNYYKKSKDQLLKEGIIDEEGKILISELINTSTNGRFHSDWLTMMYSRLKIAKSLLKKDGVIFISINDCEYENLKKICNEIFGEQNFVATLIRKVMEGGKSDSKGIAVEHEYCLMYVKDNYSGIYKKVSDKLDHYNKKDEHYEERGFYYLKPLENGGLGYVPSLDYAIKGPDGIDIYPGDFYGDNGYRWVWSKEKYENAFKKDMIEFTQSSKDKSKYKVYYKIYEKVDTDGNPSIKELPFTSLYLDGYTNRQAINDLKRVFNDIRMFDYPKPVEFLKELLRMSTKDNDIVLDFFSGSASFAQAVIELNEEEKTNRKWILIQIPESTDQKTEAYKNGYKTLCDLGEARIKNVLTNVGKDSGFRTYKVDETNMKDVFYKPGEINQLQLNGMETNIKEDRSDEDLLTQVILDLGIELNKKIECRKIDDVKVWVVDDGQLIACLEDNISLDIVEGMTQIDPFCIKYVFKESCFATDSDKINCYEIIKKNLKKSEKDIQAEKLIYLL